VRLSKKAVTILRFVEPVVVPELIRVSPPLGWGIGSYSLHNGALLAQGDRHLRGLCRDATPDVQFFLEHEALLDHEHLLDDRKDRHVAFGPDLGCGLDHFVDGHTRDLHGFPLHVRMSEFLDGVGDRLHTNAPGDDLPLAECDGLFDERNDLLGDGAGAAPHRIVQNGHRLIIVWRYARRIRWVAHG
jgi:hypothetical protein